MPIAEIVLNGFPGAKSVVSPLLAYVIPLKVCWDNKTFVVVSTTPGNLEARHVSSEGRITFNDTFQNVPVTSPGPVIFTGPSIYIKYKY